MALSTDLVTMNDRGELIIWLASCKMQVGMEYNPKAHLMGSYYLSLQVIFSWQVHTKTVIKIKLFKKAIDVATVERKLF